MFAPFKSLISRIRFYVFLLGGFLGLEIPLIVFTYFKIFPKYRSYVWLVTFFVGLLSAYIVHYMIKGIINEDYRIKLLFDTTEYNEQEVKK
jgi:hypothetical protein